METIALGAPTPRRCLRQTYGNFKVKTYCNKKINDILFEIELSEFKYQQSYPMNECFQGPMKTSNNSNMMSQNTYSTPRATYAKTSFPVSP